MSVNEKISRIFDPFSLFSLLFRLEFLLASAVAIDRSGSGGESGCPLVWEGVGREAFPYPDFLSTSMKIIRSIVVPGILILFLTLFSGPLQTFKILSVTWRNVIAAGNFGMLCQQARIPRSGEGVLPPAVQAGIELLRNNSIKIYRYSLAFEQNIELKQRLIEGAYPLRYEKDAKYLLLLEREPLEQNCSYVSRKGEVILAHCP